MEKEGGIDYKGEQRNFWSDGYIHYLDCGNGEVSGVVIYVKNHQIVPFKYVQCTICQLYLNEAVKKKHKLITLFLFFSITLNYLFLIKLE